MSESGKPASYRVQNCCLNCKHCAYLGEDQGFYCEFNGESPMLPNQFQVSAEEFLKAVHDQDSWKRMRWVDTHCICDEWEPSEIQ